MFGIFLSSVGSFFEEVASSIGKKEVAKREETVYSMGFLNLFWGAVILIGIGLWRHNFIFSTASLPTFLIRAVLEVLQAYVSILAITTATRSTFGFLRTLTIPLLLGVDIILGYAIAPTQIVGMSVIVLALFFLFMNHGLDKKGIALILFSTINAVITISLYKYNITHWNSVEAEQSLIYLILLSFFFLMATFKTKERPWRLFKKSIFIGQSLSQGVGSLLESFAYAFAPASIILATKRSSSVLWSVLSGGIYFKEKHFTVKIITLLLIISGIILLII